MLSFQQKMIGVNIACRGPYCPRDALDELLASHDGEVLALTLTEYKILMASMAEQERIRTLSRQADGIAAAKLQSKHLGRPKIAVPDGWDEIYELWKSGRITAVEAMKRSGLKKSTFYKLVRLTEADPPG